MTTTFPLVVIGVLGLEVLLVWGYFAVLERGSGSVVATGLSRCGSVGGLAGAGSVAAGQLCCSHLRGLAAYSPNVVEDEFSEVQGSKRSTNMGYSGADKPCRRPLPPGLRPTWLRS
jgi:hypothetical protein